MRKVREMRLVAYSHKAVVVARNDRCDVDIAPQIHAKSQQSPPEFPFEKGRALANFQNLFFEANR